MGKKFKHKRGLQLEHAEREREAEAQKPKQKEKKKHPVRNKVLIFFFACLVIGGVSGNQEDSTQNAVSTGISETVAASAQVDAATNESEKGSQGSTTSGRNGETSATVDTAKETKQQAKAQSELVEASDSAENDFGSAAEDAYSTSDTSDTSDAGDLAAEAETESQAEEGAEPAEPAGSVEDESTAAAEAPLESAASVAGDLAAETQTNEGAEAETPADPAEDAVSTEETPAEDAEPSLAWVAGDEFLAYVDAYVAEHPESDSGDYVELDDNVPYFTAEDATTEAFQSYADLDSLRRCVCAYACLGPETLATEKRGDISDVHPSGWHSGTYDFLDSASLYTRTHLIAFSLSGQNDNVRNLITGTWHMNVEVMSNLEYMVLEYIRNTGNHVLYRVIPVFSGDELVARGVHMEALSMEDGGQGVSLNIYLRNIEPGVAIDYATGDSWPDGTITADEGAATTGEQGVGDAGAAAAVPAEAAATEEAATDATTYNYVVNTNTGKFHYPGCKSVKKMADKNRWDVTISRDELIAAGYSPCGNCNP